MAFEIEIITDDRFLHKYLSDDIEKECKNMLEKIKSNLLEKDIYFEIVRDVYMVNFDTSIQYRCKMFIQLKNRTQKKKEIYFAVNSVNPTYFKEVANKKIN